MTKHKGPGFNYEFVEGLVKKYGLDNSILIKTPQDSQEYIPFKNKWKNFCYKNFPGIDLGPRLPDAIYKVLDEFLDYVKLKHPTFKIQQIKVKFDDVRVYLEGVSEETREELYLLEEYLILNRIYKE